MSQTMFSETQSGDLTFDATSGLATGVANVKKQSIIAGTMAGITDDLSGDKFTVGLGKTIATGLKIYAGAQLGRRAVGGEMKLNPFSA